MIVQTNLPLSISIKSSSKDAQKSLQIINGFIATLPVIINELARRSLIASKEIAPYRNVSFMKYGGDYEKPSGKSRYSTGGFSVDDAVGGELRDSIYLKKSSTGFSLGTAGLEEDTEVKAVMQEFGYPQENYWGPYAPNPKRKPYYSGTAAGRIKGLGYLRVAMIIAADSLNNDNGKGSASSISYTSVPSRADVRNYQQVVERRLTQVISKFLTAYAKGNLATLPGYYQNKVQAPVDTISKYASSFGNIQSLKINVPVRIEYGGQTFNYAGLSSSSYLR